MFMLCELLKILISAMEKQKSYIDCDITRNKKIFIDHKVLTFRLEQDQI